MKAEHTGIQQWIKEHYGHMYKVAAEIDKQNRLPDQKRHWYQPDVVLRDGQGEIKYIIEVENDPVRKALVGASILADCSIAELGQQTKPALIFVVYSEKRDTAGSELRYEVGDCKEILRASQEHRDILRGQFQEIGVVKSEDCVRARLPTFS